MSVTFSEFLNHASPGARYVYHIGLLMKDRQQHDGWSQTYSHNELHYAAEAVWDAYEKGYVYLVQQRQSGSQGLGVYVYIAIKRRSPVDSTRDDGRDYSGRELFGSFSGPRSSYGAAHRRGAFAANADRAG